MKDITVPGWSPLGYRVFLDRYAQKGNLRSDSVNHKPSQGDLLLVRSTDNDKERKEIAYFRRREDDIIVVNWQANGMGEEAKFHVDRVDWPIETTPEQVFQRVAEGASVVEPDSVAREGWSLAFTEMMVNKNFIPGGRILTGCGTNQKLTYYNCFVLPSPHDSQGGIFATLSHMAHIFTRGGGVGINLSTLRPKFHHCKGVNGRSSGAVSWGGLYSFTTGLIEQGGSRRGALMLILNVWHPDVLDFIDSKRDMKSLLNANISVGLTDAFMEAVRDDLDWNLEFPDVHGVSEEVYDRLWKGNLTDWKSHKLPTRVWNTVKARSIWQKIKESAWASAEPGLFFLDTANRTSNSNFYSEGEIICTNPCGEQPLPAWSVCNLGHVNLGTMVKGPIGSAEWDLNLLDKTVALAVRFLDNIINVTPYFIPENEKQAKFERRIGLGTMGLAEALIRRGIRYGSPESLREISMIYERIALIAYDTSMNLARERGPGPFWSHEFSPLIGKKLGIQKEKPFRNVTLLTQAPTGTVGTMMGTSTGIEPYYALEWERQTRLGKFKDEINILAEWRSQNPDRDPNDLPSYFTTAMELTPEEHVAVMGAIQPWVDSAISKTCNVPEEWSADQIGELYELMWRLGCKGGTVYRDNCRNEQILTPVDNKPKHKPKVRPRPHRREGTTISKPTPVGTAHVIMNDDEAGSPFELFIETGKSGSDIKAMSEALGRSLSLVFRMESSLSPHERVQEIVKQLRGIGGQRSQGFGKDRVLSLPDAVAQALEENYLNDEIEVTYREEKLGSKTIHTDYCPECGNTTLQMVEGCQTCSECGFSEC